LSTKLAAWAFEVKEHDDCLRAEDAHTQKIIDSSNAAWATHHGEKKDLLSWLTKPPLTGNRSSTTSTMGKTSNTGWKYLPALTPCEQTLLSNHASCTCCRLFNAGHTGDTCPMKANNIWPDPATYMTLTALPAAAAITGTDEDNETDSYVPPPVEVPFTIPHLYTSISITSPLITEFPITV
jgi:hypothetical protein